MTLPTYLVDKQKPIYTRSRRTIPLPEHKRYVELIEYLEKHNVINNTRAALTNLGDKKNEVCVRSVPSNLYDCVGMIFSNRRAWIGTDKIHDILKNDGYCKIEERQVSVGDIVLYSANQEFTHIGMITYIRTVKGIKDIRVLSKWGFAGEFEHHLHVVPRNIGSVCEYWSERIPYVG